MENSRIRARIGVLAMRGSAKRTICSIGSTDPTAAAGIGRDLGIFERLGARGVFAVAAVTAQNSRSVGAVEALAPRVIVAQLRAIWQERKPDAIRIGLLPDAEGIRAVTRFLRKKAGRTPIVLDPVLAASSGRRFAGPREIAALKRLMTLCTIVTPNASEAQHFSGVIVRDARDAERAAHALAAIGPAVLVKGGHLRGSQVTDVLVDAGSVTRFRSRRIGSRLHGSGCTLAAALAVALARGEPLVRAVRFARRFVRAELMSRAG